MRYTFIAIENPMSMIGSKGENHPLFKAEKATTKLERSAAKEKDKNDALKWDSRKAVLDDIKEKVDIDNKVNKSHDNDMRIAADFERSQSGSVRRAVSGSLASLFKRLVYYGEQEKIKFDTIIFLGHGDVGSMSAGMGKISIVEESVGEPKYRKKAREVLEPHKREISGHNVDIWKSEFQRVEGHLETGGALHIFLLGCSTGEAVNLAGVNTSLVRIVATTLATEFKTTVIAYGPSNEIDGEATSFVLENLEDIKTKAIGSAGATSQYRINDEIDLNCFKNYSMLEK